MPSSDESGTRVVCRHCRKPFEDADGNHIACGCDRDLGNNDPACSCSQSPAWTERAWATTTVQALCPTHGTPDLLTPCGGCRGTGNEPASGSDAPAMYFACSRCGGRGHVITEAS